MREEAWARGRSQHKGLRRGKARGLDTMDRGESA